LNDDPAIGIVASQLPMAVFQSVGMLFLLFVSFYKPGITKPLWIADAWVRYMPYVHAVITLFTFILFPLIVMFMTFVNTANISQSEFKSALWIYCFTSFVVAFVWFPTQILNIVKQAQFKWQDLKDARILRANYKSWEEMFGPAPAEAQGWFSANAG
jgi:hypothetical protein